MKNFFRLLLCTAACFAFAVVADASDGEKPTPAECMFTVYSRQQAEEIAQRIADKTECWPGYYTDEASTVWLVVRITDNPELANLQVFRRAVVKMTNKSRAATGDVYWDTDSVMLMGYNRVAGELALHVGLIMLIDLVAPEKSEELAYWYERFDLAEINIDEHRLPTPFMNFVGDTVMDILPFFFPDTK